MITLVDKPVLPKELTETKVEPKLLAQAVRVYQANQRQGTQSALTRSEISRTRKKLYKQKGTGGARHGDRKAPIFVGGGIAFAPKPRDYSLNLSQKMRHLAMLGALNAKIHDKALVVIAGLDKVAKTKEAAKFIEGRTLVITDKIRDNVWKAFRNIPKTTVLPVNQLNAFSVLEVKKVLMMEEAIPLFGEVKPIEKVKEVKKVKVVKKVTVKK